MSLVRHVLCAIVILGLLFGYLLNQAAYFGWTGPSSASVFDSPIIRWAALISVIVAIFFCVYREDQADES